VGGVPRRRFRMGTSALSRIFLNLRALPCRERFLRPYPIPVLKSTS
jgi:hypothetical protein